jgi:hypothetical protein
MDKINNTGHDDVSSECFIYVCKVCVAVCKLKPNKGDGYFGLTSDHLTNVCGRFASSFHICRLVTTIVNCIPVFRKVLNLVTLTWFSDKQCVSDLQLMFRSKVSTDMCTMLLRRLPHNILQITIQFIAICWALLTK